MPAENVPDTTSGTEVPPAMPAAVTPEPAAEKPTTHSGSTMAAPAQKADGWEVDPDRLRSFTDAVVRARSYLDAVEAKVNRMQGAELTPQIGTSPVGQQLAKKFDDRLNSADGLRAKLVEAMKRMDDFVTSAEKAASTYDELEQNAVDAVTKNG
jgi:hypothetical protein